MEEMVCFFLGSTVGLLPLDLIQKPEQTCTDLRGIIDPKSQVRLEAKAIGLGGKEPVIALSLR
jgi:hypothetical protein